MSKQIQTCSYEEKLMKDLPTRYDHHRETEAYERWEAAGQFKAQGDGPVFSMACPPPNVTGDLHLGHALVFALHDTICRNRRRQGDKVLMIPGVDHAGIGTETLVERKLAAEGQRKYELGREKFLAEVGSWVEHYLPRAKDSIKKFGTSCDWDHFRFTMDEKYQWAVKTAFLRLYDQGLIYRDKYLVNWDPKLRTAIADDEVSYKVVAGHLYWIKYGPITAATTRPETKLGDTAIAVNPKDPRYKSFIGREIEFTNETGAKQKLLVIADEAVDQEFGTGALKVTPAHDQTDYQLGLKHQLAFKSVIGPDGRMNAEAGLYAGLKVAEAREKIVADLQRQGLIEKITDHTIRQPIADRSGAVIEPLISTEWFLKTTALKDQAMKVVKDKRIQFLPKNLEKVYFHWLDNLHDWCISRQIWWGHQLPVYYCQNQDKFVVAKELPSQCPICGSCSMKQSEEVLDTWFSSALWPFATLGWPDSTEDLRIFFPTSLMETGADILFFWVSRMIMMGLALTKEIPFRQVYFHGLILDEHGQKMSKSKGNALDPLKLIEQYGADTLRMGLIGDNSPGLPQKFSLNKLLKYRNFVTKIWNASRFVATVCPNTLKDKKPQANKDDFFERLEKLEKKHQQLMDKLQLNVALEELYNFFWNDFCGNYLETKKQLIRDNEGSAEARQAEQSLVVALDRLLEPISDFAPFLVDQIRTELPK